jgi:hypothetical protein
VTWEWQAWRSFGDIRETFKEKGWKCRFNGRNEDGVMPLLAEAGDRYCISFLRGTPARERAGSSCATRFDAGWCSCKAHTTY